MGQFPYQCYSCGGGYNRCGFCTEEKCHRCDDPEESNVCASGHEKCEGGQFCWEENVVIVPFKHQKYINFKISEKKLEGKYEGYGIVNVKDYPNLDFIPVEFEEFINDWYTGFNIPEGKVVLVKRIYCESCYDKTF